MRFIDRLDVDMEKALEFQKEYIETYPDQFDWKNYSAKTYINDMLYGIGASIGEEFRYADGFDRFKAILRDHLKEDAK